MSELLSVFGIDWRLLVINIVNFALLLGLLWYFLYEPLLRTLEARRHKIAEGVRMAEDAETRLAEIEGSRDTILADAGREADALVAHGRAAGTAREHELVVAGEAAATTLLRDAELRATELKAQALQESKQEVAKLIVLGMEKLALESK